MRALRPLLLLIVVWSSAAPLYPQQQQTAAAEQLMAMANQSRAQAGVGRLQWDRTLALAALKHCMRMVSEGQLAHRYGGELDLTERAAVAGAHFSLIEENIALGPDAASIHQGWLDSPLHRANLLNREIDRVGIAVVAARGNLYAVADYARAVPVLSREQVESKIAELLRGRGLSVLNDPSVARATCAVDRGLPRSAGGPTPSFVMRWQDADIFRLPRDLVSRLATGDYRRASVGSCPPKDMNGPFTVYRIAVLLYGPPTSNEIKPFY